MSNRLFSRLFIYFKVSCISSIYTVPVVWIRAPISSYRLVAESVGECRCSACLVSRGRGSCQWVDLHLASLTDWPADKPVAAAATDPVRRHSLILMRPTPGHWPDGDDRKLVQFVQRPLTLLATMIQIRRPKSSQPEWPTPWMRWPYCVSGWSGTLWATAANLTSSLSWRTLLAALAHCSRAQSPTS